MIFISYIVYVSFITFLMFFQLKYKSVFRKIGINFIISLTGVNKCFLLVS